MKSMSLYLSCLAPLVIALGACKSNPPAAAAPKPEPAKPAPAVVAAPKPTPAAPPAALAAAAPALLLTPQAGWVIEEPTSTMRKAQYSLPHADSDSEDASLVVYYFGTGQGGSKEANLQRWAGQFEQPDGSSSEEEMQSSTRTIAGLEVCDAELSGIYIAETAPGSGERVNKADWRMKASIIDTKEGPWYFKLVGPTKTVAKWEASYEAFVKAIKPGN